MGSKAHPYPQWGLDEQLSKCIMPEPTEILSSTSDGTCNLIVSWNALTSSGLLVPKPYGIWKTTKVKMLLTYPHDLPVVLKIFINAKLETSKEKRIIFWSSSREVQADSGQKFILSLT